MPQRLPSGKWKVQLRVGGRVRTFSFSRRVDAEKKEADLRHEAELVRAGMEAPREQIILYDFAQSWIKKRMRTHPASTWKQDELNLRLHWLPFFAKRPLQTITKQEVAAHLDAKLEEKKWANATYNRNLQLMHKLFEDAIDENRAIFNPVARIKRLSEKKKKRVTGYFETQEEIERYVEAAFSEDRLYGEFATLALFTGARIGEICALQFKDIDFDREQILINRTIERVSNTAPERTKGQGDGGSYILPLLPRVSNLIKEIKQRRKRAAPTDYVLERNGTFISYWTLRGAHVRIIEKAGLKKITPHDLRRTFASHAEAFGFSRGEIQAMLGHSSITTTEHYVRKSISHLTNKAKELGFGVEKVQLRLVKEITS